MCGICGKVGSNLSETSLLAAMGKMAHRGPDQQGSWINNNVMFGHQRLAIIDLTNDARQPLSNEDGTIWLVFNGEIYNFSELRVLLEQKHIFRSRTDSEVLIHGYEEWGISGLLKRIRGMFAFAIWDEKLATLHIARDHLGKKPPYYSTIGGVFAFASTLPSLLELLGTTPDVSRTAVLDYLTYMCIPSPGSIFEKVWKLPPAHRIEFRLHQDPEIIPYWRPDFSHKEVWSEQECLERIETALIDAVRDRLIADVPLGAFLSGGVDSSLIVALMTKISGHPVTTVSMGFPEKKFNELPYAQRVAEFCGSQHYEHILHPKAADILPSLIFHYGEPFADHSALPTYYLAEAARHHVTVALTGDGGDENFAGYETSVGLSVASTLNYMPNLLKEQMAKVLLTLEQNGTKAVRKLRWVCEMSRGKQGNYVFDPVGSRTFRFWNKGLFGSALEDLTINKDSDQLYQRLWNEAGKIDWVDRGLYVDMLANLPNDLLVKMDVATMAHGLETRSPLLDYRVTELTCKIPPHLKIKQWRSKYLLKKLAERYLPKELLYRRKQGFSLPTSEWLRSGLGVALKPILLSDAALRRDYFCSHAIAQLISEHQSGKADHGQRLWLLLVLELWFQMFIDKTLTTSDNLFAISPQMNSIAEQLK